MSITEKVKEYMRLKNIPHTTLAEKLNTSNQNISRILNSDDLKVSTLEKIAKALDLPIKYFFDDDLKEVIELEEIKAQLNTLQEKVRSIVAD